MVYIDDGFGDEKNRHRNLKALDEAFGRIKEAGLWLRKEKCIFCHPRPSVVYLDHQIDEQSLPVVEKLQSTARGTKTYQCV